MMKIGGLYQLKFNETFCHNTRDVDGDLKYDVVFLEAGELILLVDMAYVDNKTWKHTRINFYFMHAQKGVVWNGWPAKDESIPHDHYCEQTTLIGVCGE